MNMHSDPATDGCRECGSVTHAADCSLQRGPDTDTSGNRTCKECGREYVSQEALAQHVRSQADIREAMGADYLGHRAGGSGVVKQPDWLEEKFA